jgi:hypothetical protein
VTGYWPVDHSTIIDPWRTARLVRRQRLDDRPFAVRQFVSSLYHQASIAMENVESRGGANLKTVYEFTA